MAMSTTPNLESSSRLLMVEGYSDLLFYAEFLEEMGVQEGVFIKHFNGRTDLAAKLEIFLTPQLLASKEAFGVIVDADTDALSTANELTRVLSRITRQAVVAGAWTPGQPRVGLFVTPDGKTPGEIETLVWRAWAADPANQAPKVCIDAFMGCMGNLGLRAHSPDKGLVSALLAVRNDEDPRLGPGARANAFNFRRPEFSGLRDFLSVL